MAMHPPVRAKNDDSCYYVRRNVGLEHVDDEDSGCNRDNTAAVVECLSMSGDIQRVVRANC